MVGQPIQQRAGQGGIAEHLAPPSVFEVTGHDERPPILEELKNGTHVPQHLAQRATIILLAGEGQTNVDIARTTKWNRNTVKQWRKRWAASAPKLDKIEADQPRALRAAIGAALEDAPRSGNPGKITNIQLALILQMVCEKPEKYDVPISHWTAAALAHTAIERGIVESISARQVGRYLAEADLKPHLSRYWLNPDVEDPKEFEANVRRICDRYTQAPQLAEAGVQVHCTDEMTGIKAHEQTHPPLPMEPGKPEGLEFQYRRPRDVADDRYAQCRDGPSGSTADSADAHRSRFCTTYPQCGGASARSQTYFCPG